MGTGLHSVMRLSAQSYAKLVLVVTTGFRVEQLETGSRGGGTG